MTKEGNRGKHQMSLKQTSLFVVPHPEPVSKYDGELYYQPFIWLFLEKGLACLVDSYPKAQLVSSYTLRIAKSLRTRHIITI